jgi:hypothetical protein
MCILLEHHLLAVLLGDFNTHYHWIPPIDAKLGELAANTKETMVDSRNKILQYSQIRITNRSRNGRSHLIVFFASSGIQSGHIHYLDNRKYHKSVVGVDCHTHNGNGWVLARHPRFDLESLSSKVGRGSIDRKGGINSPSQNCTNRDEQQSSGRRARSGDAASPLV